MTSSVSLSSPFAIAPLPHLSNIQESRSCFAATVLTVQSKKRKRTEVAVAVDGQGVSILDVHAAKVLSTYTLPPATRFSCTPVSVKGAKRIRRRTYAAVSYPKKQIVCWEEKVTKRSGTSIASSPAGSDYGTVDREIEIHTRPVKFNLLRLDIIARPTTALTGMKTVEEDLLAVYDTGLIQCFSTDLKINKWNYNPKVGKVWFDKTIFVHVSSLALARKTILRKRPDVLAGIDDQPGSLALLTISTDTEATEEAELKLFAIYPSYNVGQARELIRLPFTLPEQLNSRWDQTKISYHVNSGTLHLLCPSSIATFSLMHTIPTLQSIIGRPDVHDPSIKSDSTATMLHTSSTNILFSTSTSIGFYDTKYQSIHASVPNETVDEVSLMLYLRDADLLVGYTGDNIVGIQVTRTGSFTGSTLMDSLCKGSKTIKPKGLEKLASAASKKDVTAFEQEFAEIVGLELVPPVYADEGLDNQGSIGRLIPNFSINRDNTQLQRLTQPFVAAVLSMILTEVTPGELQIQLPASHVLSFLIEEGYFSCTSLPNHGQGLVQALVKHDPDLVLLLSFLSRGSTRTLPLEEVVQAIQVALEDGANPTLNGAPGDPGMSEEEAIQLATAEAEAAQDDLEHILELREVKEEVITLCLNRINKFPKSAVVQAFRSGLGGAELAALIRILRRELISDGDGLPEYIPDEDEEEYEEGYEEPEARLGLVCDALICAIDAAGMTGLLLAKDSLVVVVDQESSSALEAVQVEELLLTSLSDEVSTACQSLEDAGSLSILLDNLVKRSGAIQAAQPPERLQSLAERQRNQKTRNGVELKRLELEERRKAVLPLGYPAKPDNQQKGKKTPESARAARTERVMKSLRIGAYTLERLEI